LEFFVLPHREWVGANEVDEGTKIRWCNDPNGLERALRGASSIFLDVEEQNHSSVSKSDEGKAKVIEYKHKSYRFENGTSFGLNQYEYVFTGEELKRIQKSILKMIQPSSLSELRPNTVDVNEMGTRLKLFLNYRYSYGKELKGTDSELFDDVDKIENFPIIGEIIDRLELLGIVSQGFLNQCVVNVYKEKRASLGVHTDDPELFERPILSLRLFSDSVLSFGCTGLQMTPTEKFIPVVLTKGCVTSMEGIAANNFNHCIRPKDITEFSVSLIFRRVKVEKLKRKLNDIKTE